MSRLFSPSAPSVGLEAWGLGPSGSACRTWSLGVPLGRGRGWRGSRRLWQVAGEGEGGWEPSLSLSQASWRLLTCLPLTVILQDPLHLVLPDGCVEDSGALGGAVASIPAAPCPLPLALGVSRSSRACLGIWLRCSRPELVHFQPLPR